MIVNNIIFHSSYCQSSSENLFIEEMRQVSICDSEQKISGSDKNLFLGKFHYHAFIKIKKHVDSCTDLEIKCVFLELFEISVVGNGIPIRIFETGISLFALLKPVIPVLIIVLNKIFWRRYHFKKPLHFYTEINTFLFILFIVNQYELFWKAINIQSNDQL